MAVTIVNVSTTKFSINGVEYLKNFQSTISGNNLRIFGVYDNALELVPLTVYSDFTVDGGALGSAVLLQTALLNVLYNRNNIGSDHGYQIIDTVTDFNDLVTAGTSGVWLVLTSFTMSASKTIPADVTLEFRNTQINLGGFTLTGTNTQITQTSDYILNTNGGAYAGTWNIEYSLFEWFGAVGDDSTSDSSSIQDAIEFTVNEVRGSVGKTYLLDSQIIIPANKNIKINLQGSTLKRKSTYTTAEPQIKTTTGTSEIKITNGHFQDDSNILTDSFIYVFEITNFHVEGITIESEGSGIVILGTDDVSAIRCTYENLIATPLNGSKFIDISNSKNVLIDSNTIKNSYASIYVQAIGTARNDAVKVINNTILTSESTAIFVRMIGTGSNGYRGANISGNYLENAGKAGIKFTSPSGAVSGELESAIISNNHIKGFAFQVASAGIMVFRDSTNPLISIENIVISNNIVDGFGTSGTESTLNDTGVRGILCSYVDYLTMNGNVVRNCVSDGIKIDNSNFITGFGNVIENCCLDVVGTAGMLFLKVISGTWDCVSISNQNTSDGIFIDQSQELIISGNYSNNTQYGINEDSSGTTGTTKSARNTYKAILINNTTNPIRQRGDTLLDSSREMHCIDDSGDRHTGTATRRDAIDNEMGTARNKGFSFWNTDNNDVEVWNGTSWVKADGTAVDS